MAPDGDKELEFMNETWLRENASNNDAVIYLSRRLVYDGVITESSQQDTSLFGRLLQNLVEENLHLLPTPLGSSVVVADLASHASLGGEFVSAGIGKSVECT